MRTVRTAHSRLRFDVRQILLDLVGSRFVVALGLIEHDLNVKPNEFERFEEEASRLAAEAGDVAVELGWGQGGAEELLRYAAACTDAVEFARKYDAEGIWYW